jgi:hypothetical protein
VSKTVYRDGKIVSHNENKNDYGWILDEEYSSDNDEEYCCMCKEKELKKNNNIRVRETNKDIDERDDFGLEEQER